MGVALDRVVAALVGAGCQRARANGDWTCPAHEDRNPSLSVSNGAGRVLIHCHAGCPTESVLGRIGLSMVDLYDYPPAREPESRIVETYDYTDEHGELLFQIVRLDPKGFRQRRPDGRGGWVWNVKGVRPVPYHLDELVGAEEVWVAEGEKDVDALRVAGVVATCNPGGANKEDVPSSVELRWRPGDGQAASSLL